PGHDGLRSKSCLCAVDRSYLQPCIVGEHDLTPVCSTRVETGSNHHCFRHDDSCNLRIVILCGKLSRDVDRVAYRRQGPRRVVTSLTDTSRPRMQMDDTISRPTQFLCESITQGVKASVDLCRFRERLLVALFRF